MPLHPYQFYRIYQQPSPISHMFVEVKTAWKCIASRECYCSSNTFPRTRFLLTVGDSGVIKRYIKNMYIQKCLILDIDPWFVCLKRCRSGVDIEKKNPLQQREQTYKHTYPETTPRCRGFSSCAFFLQQVSWTSFNGWGTRTIVGGGLDLLMGFFFFSWNHRITYDVSTKNFQFLIQ